MNRLTRVLLVAACAAALAGCATSRTLPLRTDSSSPIHPGVPLTGGAERLTYFSGSRLNLAALRDDDYTLDDYAVQGVQPPRYPLLDLAPSLAADSVMLPLVTLDRVDESLDTFWDFSFERYPVLRLTYQVPFYVMASPFYAALYLDDKVRTWIASR